MNKSNLNKKEIGIKRDQGQSLGKWLWQVGEAETVEEQVRVGERRRGNELRRGEGQGGGGRGQKGQGRMVKGDRVRAKGTNQNGKKGQGEGKRDNKIIMGTEV